MSQITSEPAPVWEVFVFMSIDKEKIKTQDEQPEPAPIDQIEERVEAEMELIEGQAKERVAQGLQNPQLEDEARKQEAEAEQKFREKSSD
jgi:hypothetical protein